MVLKLSDDKREQKLIHNITEFGWHTIHVLGDDESVEFTYTVGLFHSFQHPELIVMGLAHEISHGIFSLAADIIRSGETLTQETHADQLIEGTSAYFLNVDRANYAGYTNFCTRFYEGMNYPLTQIIWPSKTGALPWQKEAPTNFALAQPVLGNPC